MPGGSQQGWHIDLQTSLFLALEDDTYLLCKIDGRAVKISLRAGEGLLFGPEFVHARAVYQVKNSRVHVYLKEQGEKDENYTGNITAPTADETQDKLPQYNFGTGTSDISESDASSDCEASAAAAGVEEESSSSDGSNKRRALTGVNYVVQQTYKCPKRKQEVDQMITCFKKMKTNVAFTDNDASVLEQIQVLLDQLKNPANVST